jgi:tetratricopeptide (TPR) repeat protein
MKTTDKNHHLYPRWVFYLAQCYDDIGDYDNAVKVYEERCNIKYGFNEEIYVSLLRIANIKRNLGLSEHELIDAYLRCLLENPNRAEHLPPIIEYYQSTNRYQIAYIYSSYAMKFAETSPKDSSLFIDISVYNWKIYDLHNLSCWWSGRIDEAKETFRKLWSQVEKGVVDEDQIPRLIGNKKFNM